MYIDVWDINKFKNGLEDDDEQCCYLPRYGTDITGLGIYYYVILVDSVSLYVSLSPAQGGVTRQGVVHTDLQSLLDCQ
jgi:hypothetical protein